MIVSIDTVCPAACGARVAGEVDTISREFVHRFQLPAGKGAPSARTEVGATHLATFSPDSKDWFVSCPVCSTAIPIDLPAGTGA